MLIISQLNNYAQAPVSQLEFPLNFDAEDSMVMDIKSKVAYLYGNAHIDYGEYKLDACVIKFDLETNIVTARMCLDSLGKPLQVPELSDGNTVTSADSLKFNFDTKRGVTYRVKMQEGEGYIHGNKVKRQEDGSIHIDTALYTTCDLDHPHYYFKLRKAIIIPDDKIVSGPINLFISDIPTPLGLPFAFIPNQEKRKNGIIMPQYGRSVTQGFFLSGGGYYHKFKSEQLAMRITGDIFTRGSWGLGVATDYRTRYKRDGNFSVTYRNTRLGEREFNDFSVTQDFIVNWRHRQDPKSIPSMTFSAQVEAGTSTAYRNNFGTNVLNSNDYLKNNFNSSISFSKTFKKLPSNLSVNLRHAQNNSTNRIDFTLPEVTYGVNRFFPFKWLPSNKAFKSSFRKQVEKIGVNYTGNFKTVTFADASNLSLQDMSELGENLRTGAKHNLNIATSLNAGPFTVTPNITSNALNYLESYRLSYDNEEDSLITDTISGYRSPIWNSYSLNVTTKIYGFYEFAEFLKGKKNSKVRHTITPNLGFRLSPDNGYNFQYQQDTIIRYYSPFQGQVFGAPPQGNSGKVTFSLINAFEMRQNNLDGTDSLTEPFIYKSLLDNITFSTGYDMIADSLNWDNVDISGRTNIAKLLSLRFGASLDPYERDTNNVIFNEFVYNTEDKLFNLTNASLNLGFNLSNRNKQEKLESEAGSEEELDYINNNRDEYVEFGQAWQWNAQVGYTISYNKIFRHVEGDTIGLIQTLNLSGSMNITKNMNVNFQTNYDIAQRQFSFTSVNITRDLHCWQMALNWVPFGFQKSWSIQINVKSALLQDLKLQRRQIWLDNGVR